MEVVMPKGRFARWAGREAVWNRDAPDKRIWRVVYYQFAVSRQSLVVQYDLSEVEQRLLKALEAIRKFADSYAGRGFVACFDRGIAALEKGERTAYHQDLAPDGLLSSRSIALLNACQHAWVFGGMGSWNDHVFNGLEQDVYEQVSERLFAAMTEAICAAANSSFESTGST